jgi:hypothetical protein
MTATPLPEASKVTVGSSIQGEASLPGARSSDEQAAVELDKRRLARALELYISESQSKFERRFPGFQYTAEAWNFKAAVGERAEQKGLQEIHDTKLTRLCPGVVDRDLKGMHPSFSSAARAVLANRATDNKNKLLVDLEHGLRLLKHLAATPGAQTEGISVVTLESLREVEKAVIARVKTEGLSADAQRTRLMNMYAAMEMLQQANVVPRMNARLSADARDDLRRIALKQAAEFRQAKALELDPSVAALSDAITAMADDHPALSITHKAVLSVMGLEMCAPSRINEVMTLSLKDRLTSSMQYEDQPETTDGAQQHSASSAALKLRRDLHRVHEELRNNVDAVLTMKGSKGAAWGPKPILDFMLAMFNECFDRLVMYGERSRMLVLHYESEPNRLFLPASLETLRGSRLHRWHIGRIMLLAADASDSEAAIASQHVVRVLVAQGKAFNFIQGDGGSVMETRDGRTGVMSPKRFRSDTIFFEWGDVETELLKRVHVQMEAIRWVTATVRYAGKLSNMLMLHDVTGLTPPYLPGALDGKTVRKLLKPTKSGGRAPAQTVFDVLGITMPVGRRRGGGGRDSPVHHEHVPAYCSPHDPRRWLTTQALRVSGGKLSNVVLAKWANRKGVSHVGAYNYETAEEVAERTALPMPENAAGTFSSALGGVQTDRSWSRDYGLKTRLITSGSKTIEVTSMEEVRGAVEDRPAATAGDKIIILYPTRFGVCLHQHHERPCTAFNGCGGACNEQIFVKGDPPSNSQTREEAKTLVEIIVAQIRPLVLAHARGVVHDSNLLEDHILALVKPHMSAEEVAKELIKEFHAYKHLIKDAAFRSRLEDAHVLSGVCSLLDDPAVASGALIRYDSPSRHGSPELQRSIDALGGKDGIQREVDGLVHRSPWFAPVTMDDEALARFVKTGSDAANDSTAGGEEAGRLLGESEGGDQRND